MRPEHWLYTIPLRLRSLFRHERAEQDLNDEIVFHLDQQIAENIANGLAPDDARRAALRAMEGLELHKEECRDMRRVNWVEDALYDLRYAFRTLRKNPVFTAVAVLTLALGIGANTAIFSVVEGVVLAPLPYSHPEQLVAVLQNNLTLQRLTSVSYPDFLDWRRNGRSFQEMAAFTFHDFDLTSPGISEHLVGRQISEHFFTALGVKLELGRDISVEEDKHGGAPVVIISENLWRNRFARDPAVLGKVVTLDGVDHTVVGVLPSGFHLIGDVADVYTPLGQGDPLDLNNRAVHPGILSIARLKPGVSLTRAQLDMTDVQENLNKLYPTVDGGLGVDVEPLKQIVIGDVSETLLLLLGAVGIVLLVACGNFASLLLARSAAREREFAIRAALGASSWRTVRQLVTESVLLSLAGAGLGLAFAKWGVSPLLLALPKSLPRGENIGLNVVVLLFAFGVSIVVGILFGLAPAFKSSKIDLHATLKEGSRGSTRFSHRAQSSLVIIQVALTLVLLVSAGLLFRTTRNLWDVNPGFETRNIIAFRVVLPGSVMKSPSSTRIAYQQLTEHIRELPGIVAVDLTTLVPLSGQSNFVPFWIGTQRPRSVAEAPRALAILAGPDYLKVMGIRLLRGRFFNEDDTTNSAPVAVIDSALARAYFSDKDPLGQTITFPQVGEYRIVGVATHVRHWGLDDPKPYSPYQAYAAFYQVSDQFLPGMHASTTVVVRSAIPVGTVMSTIKKVIHGPDSDEPVYDVQTMPEIVSRSMSSQRFPMMLLGAFAGLAMLLASVGIYGLMAYSVQQRTQEIGIRIALGAGKNHVFRMVIVQGLRLCIMGLAIGAVAAFILTRLLSSFSHLLYGVRASDPGTFVAVAIVLIGVAILACYIPARRATRVDPMATLRNE